MKKDSKNEPRVLIYDIETIPMKAWVWRCGDQVIRPNQLLHGFNQYDIICIGYCWNDGKPARVLEWSKEDQNSKNMIEQFDELVKQADYTLGKNSDRFDVKHINTMRLLHDLPPMPEWMMYTDDLEKQMRKHFYLASQGLDYISDLLGHGGKNVMCMQDWIDIVDGRQLLQLERDTDSNNAKGVCKSLYGKSYTQVRRNYKQAMTKMTTYCGKDVEDTRAIWNKVAAHCKPRYNYAAGSAEHICKHCGSKNIKANGTRRAGKTIYQQFYCNDHGGYAGRAPISKAGKIGTIG